MSLLSNLKRSLSRKPKSVEDLAAEAESQRVADEVATTRVSQRSGSAGENYQSGRGSKL